MSKSTKEIESTSEFVTKPVLPEVPDYGLCKEKNCTEKASKDYNGHKHYVCDYHYRKLNDYFDEEYR